MLLGMTSEKTRSKYSDDDIAEILAEIEKRSGDDQNPSEKALLELRKKLEEALKALNE